MLARTSTTERSEVLTSLLAVAGTRDIALVVVCYGVFGWVCGATVAFTSSRHGGHVEPASVADGVGTAAPGVELLRRVVDEVSP